MTPSRSAVAAWLRAIPQSRHQPRPLADLPYHEAVGEGLAVLLETWGAVVVQDGSIRAASQPAFYFLHSLAAWMEMDGHVIEDW